MLAAALTALSQRAAAGGQNTASRCHTRTGVVSDGGLSPSHPRHSRNQTPPHQNRAPRDSLLACLFLLRPSQCPTCSSSSREKARTMVSMLKKL